MCPGIFYVGIWCIQMCRRICRCPTVWQTEIGSYGYTRTTVFELGQLLQLDMLLHAAYALKEIHGQKLPISESHVNERVELYRFDLYRFYTAYQHECRTVFINRHKSFMNPSLFFRLLRKIWQYYHLHILYWIPM